MLGQVYGVLRDVWQHPANRGRRGRQVAHAVRFQLNGRVLGRRTRTPIGERSWMWAELHKTGSSRVVYANPPDWPEMLVWRQRLRPGDLFVDVGANAGAYAVYVAELGAQVVAVEPQPELVRLLRDNLALNGIDAEVHQVALADAPGVLHFAADDAEGRIDASGGLEVRADTLDAVLGDRHAAGVKVDVEGFERLVLEGARRALAERRIGCIQLEWNDCSQSALGEDRAPVAAVLAEHGYALHRADDTGALHPDASIAPGSDRFALPA
jgi:FkbM family methyltransferase